MNERYLYKAKRIDNGEWEKGFYVEKNTGNGKKYYIYTGVIDATGLYPTDCYLEVDPSTLCQCTGIKDKNGKLIWENDIVEIDTAECFEERYAVKWSEEDARFCLESETVAMDFDCVCGRECEIIGNIFDNSDLM